MGSAAVSANNPGKHAKNAVSRLRKPPEISLEAWQIALRKQFAAASAFERPMGWFLDYRAGPL